MVARKKDSQTVSDLVVRYESAVKQKQVFSLPFEATSHLDKFDQEGFVAAVNQICKQIGKELMLMRQVRLLDDAILAPKKSAGIWIPEIVTAPNTHNLLVTLDSMVDKRHVPDFVQLLKTIVKQPGIYEIVPGLALFGDNNRLRVTTSRKFLSHLNNE